MLHVNSIMQIFLGILPQILRDVYENRYYDIMIRLIFILRNYTLIEKLFWLENASKKLKEKANCVGRNEIT